VFGRKWMDDLRARCELTLNHIKTMFEQFCGNKA